MLTQWQPYWTLLKQNLTYFNPVLHFTEKPVIWFTMQIKWLVSICNATPSWTGLTENENIICEKCLFTHFMPLVSFYIPCKHQKTSGENKFGWKCYYKTKPFRGLFEEFCTQSYILHLKARTKTFLLEKIKFFANIR